MKKQILWAFLGGSFCLLINCTPVENKEEQNGNEALLSTRLWTGQDQQFIIAELNRTTTAVSAATKDLSTVQWNYRAGADRWTVREIVEHLALQNELHFREIFAISKTPQLLPYVPVVKGWDERFQAYATDTTTGTARWYLEPVGRFCSGEDALTAFQRVRSHLLAFVQETPTDLRKHFTFRNYIEGKPLEEIEFGEVRDLHQLLLTGIAHTDRHLEQISRIKQHPGFPH